MKYMIYCESKKIYFSGKADCRWTESYSKGMRYTSEQSAKNALTTQLNDKDPKVNELKIIPIFENAKSPEDFTEDFIKQLEKETKNFSLDIVPNLNYLLIYYNKQLSNCDLIQEDILHKIEFDDSLMGLSAIRLVKKLHEVRVERRLIKDKIVFLSAFLDNKIVDIPTKIENIKKKNKKRTYKPRVLSELFS